MGKVIISTSGGGSVTSDDVTAISSHVLEGDTYLGADTNDDAGTGTMPDMNTVDSTLGGINASYPNVAIHKGSSIQFGNTSSSNERLFGIRAPKGYYNGGSYVGAAAQTKTVSPTASSQTIYADSNKILEKVTVNGVDNLTAGNIKSGVTVGGTKGTFTSTATASAKDVLKGKTAGINGVMVTGQLEVTSVTSFNAAPYSTTQIQLTWKNPSKGPCSGFAICVNEGSTAPTNSSVNRCYTGTGTNTTITAGGSNSCIVNQYTNSSGTVVKFAAGKSYRFTIWAYTTYHYTNDSTSRYLFSSSVSTSSAVATTASGRKVFTSSGTWKVPSAVRTINIHCTGGGGAGGSASGSANCHGGSGGGGGYTAYKTGISVAPNDTITVTVGAGGSDSGSAGGTSSAVKGGTTLVSALGGNSSSHGSGGSGGGDGWFFYSPSDTYGPYSGGINGNNGGSKNPSSAHKGQGTTTREFGLSSGTMYSPGGGGGGGGSYYSPNETYYSANGAAGGSGGGGAGANSDRQGSTIGLSGSAGTAGTGGGGGGGGYGSLKRGAGGAGGSGSVIITW